MGDRSGADGDHEPNTPPVEGAGPDDPAAVAADQATEPEASGPGNSDDETADYETADDRHGDGAEVAAEAIVYVDEVDEVDQVDQVEAPAPPAAHATGAPPRSTTTYPGGPDDPGGTDAAPEPVAVDPRIEPAPASTPSLADWARGWDAPDDPDSPWDRNAIDRARAGAVAHDTVDHAGAGPAWDEQTWQDLGWDGEPWPRTPGGPAPLDVHPDMAPDPDPGVGHRDAGPDGPPARHEGDAVDLDAPPHDPDSDNRAGAESGPHAAPVDASPAGVGVAPDDSPTVDPHLDQPRVHNPVIDNPVIDSPVMEETAGPDGTAPGPIDLDDPALHDPSPHGPSPHGPSPHGPSPHGPAVDDPSPHGPAVDGGWVQGQATTAYGTDPRGIDPHGADPDRLDLHDLTSDDLTSYDLTDQNAIGQNATGQNPGHPDAPTHDPAHQEPAASDHPLPDGDHDQLDLRDPAPNGDARHELVDEPPEADDPDWPGTDGGEVDDHWGPVEEADHADWSPGPPAPSVEPVDPKTAADPEPNSNANDPNHDNEVDEPAHWEPVDPAEWTLEDGTDPWWRLLAWRTATPDGRRQVITRWWWVATIALILPVVVALAVRALTPARYEASATVLLRTAASASLFPDGGTLASERSTTAELAYVGTSEFRLEAARVAASSDPVEVVVDDPGAEVPSTLRFTASSATPEAATATAQGWADTYVAARHRLDVDELRVHVAADQASLARLDTEQNRLGIELAEAQQALDAAPGDPALTAGRDTAQARLDRIDLMSGMIMAELARAQAAFTAYDGAAPAATIAVSATEPPGPASTGPGGYAAAGLLAGLVLAGLAVAAAAAFDDRVGSTGEVAPATGLEPLGHLPGAPNQWLPVSVAPGSALANRLDDVADQLDRWRDDPDGCQVVAVSSARPGEGRTSLAARLSVALAGRGHNVLVIDGDLRRPQLAAALGAPPGPGLADYLGTNDVAVEQCLHRVRRRAHLVSLPAGTVPPGRSSLDLLDSPDLHELIDQLRPFCHTILIDTPPVLDSDDAARLAETADVVVVTVMTNRSRGRAVRRAALRLARSAPVIGAVVIEAAPTPMLVGRTPPTA
ncbi:MAG: hypothetical protein ACK5RL_04995 [Acidimicrobiales bacterium]